MGPIAPNWVLTSAISDYLGTQHAVRSTRLDLFPIGVYGTHMGTTPTPISSSATRNIDRKLADHGLTRYTLALKAGIPSSTFDRKIKHPGKFTLEELGSIAAALDVTLKDLLREEDEAEGKVA